MALQNRSMVRSRTLFAAKDLEVTHMTQAVYAAVDTATSGTFGKGTLVADTRIDDSTLTGGTTDQGDLIPFLTPLTYDATGTPGWRVWVSGQSIDGFAGGETGLSLHETGLVQTTDAGEVMGIVIMGGKIPADQVVLPAGITRSTLNSALDDGMRAKGFFITNLEGVY